MNFFSINIFTRKNSLYFYKIKNKKLFKVNYEKSVYLIIEKFVFQLQHRIYKNEKKKNVKNILKLKYIFTKSWSTLIVSRLISYKLNYSKYYSTITEQNFTKKIKIRSNLLPEHYLTFLMLEPEWEAKFETNSFAYRPGFNTYKAISFICKNLKQKKYNILKFDLYADTALNILISLTNNKNKCKFLFLKTLIYKKVQFSRILKQFCLINPEHLFFPSLIKLNFIKKNLKVYFEPKIFIYYSKKFFYLNNLTYYFPNSIYSCSEFLNFKNKNSSINFLLHTKTKDLYIFDINHTKFFYLYYENIPLFRSQKNQQVLINDIIYNGAESVFNLRFYYKILDVENLKQLKNYSKIKKSFFFINLKINEFYSQKNAYLPFKESEKYLNQKKSWINLKKYYYLINLCQFLQKVSIYSNYKYLNYNTIIKKVNHKKNIVTKILKRLIFKNFFDYWFDLLYQYLFFIENLNNKSLQFFPFYFLKKKNFNIISFKLNLTFLLKKNSAKNNSNAIFKQQYYFLDFEKLNIHINLQLLPKILPKKSLLKKKCNTVNLKTAFQNNFSSFCNTFFTNQLKKTKLTFLNNILKKCNKVQKTYIEKNIVKKDQYYNNMYQYQKIKVLMNQKSSFFFAYKYSLTKFLNLNLESFYLNYLTSNHLCGFFINILLHGIEYDFYYWIYSKKKLNFKKSGFFLRYGTQIILIHPSYKTLKKSEEFFKVWGFAKNLKLKINNKEYSYSLNTTKTIFFKKDFQLKKSLNHFKTFQYRIKLKKHDFSQKFFTNSLSTTRFFNTSFVLNSKKIIFLETYGSFLFQNFFNNLDHFLLLRNNRIKINNFDLKKKLRKDKLLGYLACISFEKKIKLTKFINFVFPKSILRKTKQGLIFVGFYIYQFQDRKKICFTTFRKIVLKIFIIPSKWAIKSHLNQVKKIIKKNLTKTQKVLITNLSPIIRSWSEYYNIVSTKKIHRYCDYILFKLLWKWACKRHSKKSKKWIKSKYFHCLNGKNWIFGIYNKLEYSFYCLPNHSDIRFLKLSYFNNFSSVFHFEIIF
uniref:Group II intron maturase-specific domain-containing protein n=1 Tax=Aphanochaete elegans TaxID=764105 RepID=A0A6H1XDM0_9CHLO|nr:hypothetical protein [Aphanochaete elegans]QJA13719.1 hypothetical protein [Aphanochaete elegans]